jgi:hypothetical protein
MKGKEATDRSGMIITITLLPQERGSLYSLQHHHTLELARIILIKTALPKMGEILYLYIMHRDVEYKTVNLFFYQIQYQKVGAPSDQKIKGPSDK